MEKKSRFLPERLSDALKTLLVRAAGVALVLVGAVCIIALLFHNSYLDGVATVSTFGKHGIIGNLISGCRYFIGFVPSLFVFLCVIRGGVYLVLGNNEQITPEYNFLRVFVAVCLGCAGFGLIAPSSTFGGLCGVLVANDVLAIAGGLTWLVGVFFVLGFFVLAGIMLNITLAQIIGFCYKFWNTVRWVLTAFHLMPEKPNDTDVASEDEEIEEVEEVEDGEETELVEKPKTKKKKVIPVAMKKACAEPCDYVLPDPAFLKKSVFGKNVITPELKNKAEAMEIHFAEYGVHGKVTGIRPGPIVTLYEFMPDSGVRMVDINKTVKDMTRAMATANIRIAHIPCTELIGVEMVNSKPDTVRFGGLVGDELFVESKFRIPLALGVDIGGNSMYFDLAKMPHMLIAGRTGSGKSVFVQSIITSIVYHFTPDKCKLIIIDPKGVDFGFWDDVPHLITPIVKLDPAAAVNALKWAVREMEDRYKQLQVLNARNIESYNEIAKEKRESGEKVTRQVAVGKDDETGELLYETQNVDLSDMPYIVIIIDEVADLMSLARKEVEACVQRIAQKARAAGIHLVMATQRPDATTITGVIKANFPTRVSFQARSVIDSMTTLGEKGAEQLLACGDMLFSEAGKPPVRIHGAFITDEELTKIGKFLREQCEPEYVGGITDMQEEASDGVTENKSEIKEAKDADLYTQAKEIVLRDKKPTISYIQRRLSIGYNKAAGFMERMEQEGIVSAPDANNKRQIL